VFSGEDNWSGSFLLFPLRFETIPTLWALDLIPTHSHDLLRFDDSPTLRASLVQGSQDLLEIDLSARHSRQFYRWRTISESILLWISRSAIQRRWPVAHALILIFRFGQVCHDRGCPNPCVLCRKCQAANKIRTETAFIPALDLCAMKNDYFSCKPVCRGGSQS